MQPILYYLLRATIAAVLFYGFYKLLFSKTTFYAANRVALSVILIAIAVVPLFHYNLLPEKQPDVVPMMEMPIALDTSEYVMQEEPQPTPIPIEIPWDTILTVIYIGGVAFFLLRYIVGLTQLVQVIRTSHNLHTLSDGSILCITNKKMNPFSWFNYIILSAEDHSAENQAMIGHEQAHVHLRHSLDRLLFDLMACLFWFNPFAWLLRRELQSVHEFQADEGVITEGIDAKAYQLLLIRKSVGDIKFAMANDFLQRDLQKRITMMMKNKTNTAKKWGYALSLPLLVLIMVVLSVPKLNATVVEQQEKNEIESTFDSQDDEEVIVSGSVKGDEGLLPGVSIIIKGSSTGTVSDPEGKFSIKVRKGDVLSFSYVGYATFKHEVAESRDNLTVILEQETITHSDVEVVADSEDGKILSTQLADTEEVTVSGRVKNDEGFLPGVTVLIKDSSKGTVTDMNGRFTIKANKGDFLNFSYVGYFSVQIPVNKSRSDVTVELEHEGKILDEYVVYGYEDAEENQNKTGRLEIREKNNSETPKELLKSGTPLYIIDDVVQPKDFDLSTINPEDIKEMSVLKGKTGIELYNKEGKNGVIIIKTKEYKPKASTNLKIGKEQLYIVDGEQLPLGTDISYLSEDDIKSVSVLKGESAIDSYGEEGKDGVVIIKTKEEAYLIGNKLVTRAEVGALNFDQIKKTTTVRGGDKLKELQKKYNTDKKVFVMVELK